MRHNEVCLRASSAREPHDQDLGKGERRFDIIPCMAESPAGSLVDRRNCCLESFAVCFPESQHLFFVFVVVVVIVYLHGIVLLKL